MSGTKSTFVAKLKKFAARVACCTTDRGSSTTPIVQNNVPVKLTRHWSEVQSVPVFRELAVPMAAPVAKPMHVVPVGHVRVSDDLIDSSCANTAGEKFIVKSINLGHIIDSALQSKSIELGAGLPQSVVVGLCDYFNHVSCIGGVGNRANETRYTGIKLITGKIQEYDESYFGAEYDLFCLRVMCDSTRRRIEEDLANDVVYVSGHMRASASLARLQRIIDAAGIAYYKIPVRYEVECNYALALGARRRTELGERRRELARLCVEVEARFAQLHEKEEMRATMSEAEYLAHIGDADAEYAEIERNLRAEAEAEAKAALLRVLE